MEEKRMKTSVALSYEQGDSAPKIIASGKGYVADKIVEEAAKQKVPIHKDGTLANTLSKLEIGDTIPEELYAAVAEVLLFVEDMEQLKKKFDISET